MPVEDGHPDLYGSGYVNGTIIGMPKTGKNRDQAWELVKWLTTDDHALAQFSNDIRNVPSTASSSKSTELIPDARFKTFLTIFNNPHSTTVPITPIGLDHLQTFSNFVAKWYAGNVKDLKAGLQDVDKHDRREDEAGRKGRRQRAVSLTPVARAGAAAPARPAADRRQARRSAAWRRRRLVLLLMSPWIVGFLVFIAYPLVMSVYLSFTHYDLLNPPRWIGTANYRYMFGSDNQIWPAIRNTLWIIVVGVPLQVLFAFGISVMLTRARRGVGFFRTVFYLPALAPPVAAALGFVFLLNPATGPVNTLLGKIGIDGPLWFNDPSWAKPSLVMLSLWGIGNTMVIFLAAVLDVPRHLYESAELDGAGPFQRLRWVTLPSISPVLLFAVVLGVIQGLQYFTQAYVAATVAAGQASQAGGTSNLELGYPQGSTLFYPILLYYHGFKYFDMGYAAAMAIVLLGVSFAVTLVILINSRRWVHYGGAVR